MSFVICCHFMDYRCTVVQQLATLWVGVQSMTFQELALPVIVTAMFIENFI